MLCCVVLCRVASCRVVAGFSHAMTVMVRVGGWRFGNEEGSQIVLRFGDVPVDSHKGGHFQ